MENILFGEELDSEWYDQVLAACGLGPDLKQLPYGDQTEIGERGVTISGGQKQRVALARAVYQRKCSMVILDDVFSALDAHTSSHIIKALFHGQKGLLRDRAVLLASHQTACALQAQRVLLLGLAGVKGSSMKASAENSLFVSPRIQNFRGVCLPRFSGTRTYREPSIRSHALVQCSTEEAPCQTPSVSVSFPRGSFLILAAGQKDASVPHSSLLFDGDWLDLCKQPHLLSLLGHVARPCTDASKTAGANQSIGPDPIRG